MWRPKINKSLWRDDFDSGVDATLSELRNDKLSLHCGLGEWIEQVAECPGTWVFIPDEEENE